MRTTLNISENVLGEISKLSGVKCKTEIIDKALHEMLNRLRRQKLKGAWGKIHIDLNVRALRRRELDE
ncbi:MAG: type II toxin-antitoxin system VapB family antitoxin [Candidatus Aminicenantes bacterium]|nr:type II toxin-antitoxin system VapB family antitoxin [Candidatus Aminicenantes bacterium]